MEVPETNFQRDKKYLIGMWVVSLLMGIVPQLLVFGADGGSPGTADELWQMTAVFFVIPPVVTVGYIIIALFRQDAASMLFAFMGACVLGAGFSFGMDSRALDEEGVAAQARIARREVRRGVSIDQSQDNRTRTQTSYTHVLHVQFFDQNGTVREAEVVVDEAVYDDSDVNSVVNIDYLPSRPDTIRLSGKTGDPWGGVYFGGLLYLVSIVILVVHRLRERSMELKRRQRSYWAKHFGKTKKNQWQPLWVVIATMASMLLAALGIGFLAR